MSVSKLINVLPSGSSDYTFDCVFGYAIFPRQHCIAIFPGNIFGTNLAHNDFCQFGAMVGFAVRMQQWIATKMVHISTWQALRELARPMIVTIATTSLLFAILVVIQRCAEKQVCRVAARWIITSVENFHHVGVRLVVDKIRDARSAVAYASHGDAAISVFVAMSRPFPAFIGCASGNVSPKSLNLFSGKGRYVKMLSSHFISPISDLVRLTELFTQFCRPLFILTQTARCSSV